MRKDKAIKFMLRARFRAQQFSKDCSTKVGAVFVDPQDFNQLTQGYNGMPRGVDESPPERHERPLKYAFFEHAERNAIYNLARQRLKGSIAVLNSPPSVSDVRALVSVGVSEVLMPLLDDTSRDVATALLRETGVTVRHTHNGALLPGLENQTPQVERHVRKLLGNLAMANETQRLMCKDPNGNAAVFLSAGDYTELTCGYSGFPRGARDDVMERYTGFARDCWVESSTRNAIYNVVRPLLKGSVGIVTATACSECARAMASVGVSEVFYGEPAPDFKERWGESIAEALGVLEEVGIPTTEVLLSELGG